MKSKTVRLNGQKIHYLDTESKSKPPMVMIHGFHACSSYMSPLAKSLDPSFRLLIPDLPGFGQSEEPKTPFSIAGSAEILLRLVKKLGLRKYYLAGFSMGGGVTMEMLLRDDKKSCLGMVLIYPLCYGSHIRYDWKKRAVINFLLKASKTPISKNLLKKMFYSDRTMFFLFKKLSVTDKFTDEDIRKRVENSRNCGFRTYIEGVSSIFDFRPSGKRVFPRLKSVIILNKYDELIDPQLTCLAYQAYFPRLRVKYLNLGTHNPLRSSNQEQFNREFPGLLKEILNGLRLN